MRRVAAIAATLLGAGALAFALTAAGGGDGRYRVDAIFDNASFLIAGQDVRIAGANVGSVVDVTVTPDNRARVAMAVDGRFAPFRSDADCFIAPQSLIGERFVQCVPGSPRGRVLRAAGDRPPTVPVTNTHSPVDPDLVVDTYRMGVRERLSLIVNELGAGLAGNGDALNAAIHRAAPALQATDRVLRIVDGDRVVLGRLIDRSEAVIGQLARRRARVAAFIGRAERVSVTAAQRRGALGEGIRRLPGTLDETRRSLASLRALAVRSRPLLGRLRTAARPLARLVGDVAPLSRAARPTLRRLAAMARTGTTTLRAGAPTVARLRRFAALAVPAGSLLATLNESLRDNGVPEGLQTFVANIALALARFDRSSHILPAYVVAPPECLRYAASTTASCDGRLNPRALDSTTRAGGRLLRYLLGS